VDDEAEIRARVGLYETALLASAPLAVNILSRAVREVAAEYQPGQLADAAEVLARVSAAFDRILAAELTRATAKAVTITDGQVQVR
jgi:hypothetical protein